MKKYISILLAILFIGFTNMSCSEDPDNWRIVESTQAGVYVAGDATIYSAVASAASFGDAGIDQGDESIAAEWNSNLSSIYTWLKASGTFTITIVDTEGQSVAYGAGTTVDPSATYTTYNLAEEATFSVATDGVYKLIYNKLDHQLTIIPVNLCLVGDATTAGWSPADGATKTPMTAVLDDMTSIVTYTINNATMTANSMKFAFAGNWGYEFPYDGGKAKVHTNLGTQSSGVNINASAQGLKAGGDNFKVETSGSYTVQVQLNLRNKQFSASAVSN